MEAQIDTFVEYSRLAAQKGLVQCSSGNLSSRLDSEILYPYIFIKRSGAWMERMTKKDVSVFNLNTMEDLNDVKPSSEVKLHQQIYACRPDVNVILHSQPPFATALSCMGIPDNFDFGLIPEIPYYCGEICTVPYLDPGSQELADAVSNAVAQLFNVVIMCNHGIVVIGASYDEVIQRTVFFELASSIMLRAITIPSLSLIPKTSKIYNSK